MGRGGREASDGWGEGVPGAPSPDLLCRAVCGGAAQKSGWSEWYPVKLRKEQSPLLWVLSKSQQD